MFLMKAPPFLNDRDAMSAMSFRIPAIPIVIAGAALRREILRARKRSSFAAACDLAVRNFVAQATPVELSQCIPATLKMRIGTKASRTSHSSTTPASSKSFIVYLPVGLSQVTRLSTISCGHAMRHTTWPMSSVTPIQTPPTPVLHASL